MPSAESPQYRRGQICTGCRAKRELSTTICATAEFRLGCGSSMNISASIGWLITLSGSLTGGIAPYSGNLPQDHKKTIFSPN